MHLACAYLPQIGVVPAQVEVAEKANELVVAPTLLTQLDLSGVVATMEVESPEQSPGFPAFVGAECTRLARRLWCLQLAHCPYAVFIHYRQIRL